VCASGLVTLGARVTGLLDARMDDLPAVGRPGTRDDLPLALLVGEAVADLELHGQGGSPGCESRRPQIELLHGLLR